MTTVRNEPESADSSIEELLREVGARDEPSTEAKRDVLTVGISRKRYGSTR